MAKYPIFLDLRGRRVVLIGGGAVALRKAQSLLAAEARLVIVAEHIDDMLAVKAKGDAELINSKYSKDYLTGALLVIAATNDHELNKQIYRDCQELEILCNVVDEPKLCDFFVPAVVHRGDLQIAIGTEGQCPAYAGHLREKLEKLITDAHGEFLTQLEDVRKKIIETVSDQNKRKILLSMLVEDKSFEYFCENGIAKWQQWAERLIKEY